VSKPKFTGYAFLFSNLGISNNEAEDPHFSHSIKKPYTAVQHRLVVSIIATTTSQRHTAPIITSIMPLERRKQTSLLLLLLTLLGFTMDRANAGLRGDLQDTVASAPLNDGTSNNNNLNNNNNLFVKSEKAARIAMDLSNSWKTSEVMIDACGSMDTGGMMGYNGAIGANYGVFNSLLGASPFSSSGGGDDNVAKTFQTMPRPMASIHVYIPKNKGNEEPVQKEIAAQTQSWNVWRWF
jgi:hypothetical protein